MPFKQADSTSFLAELAQKRRLLPCYRPASVYGALSDIPATTWTTAPPYIAITDASISSLTGFSSFQGRGD